MKKIKTLLIPDKTHLVVTESIFKRTVHVFLNYSSKEFDEWAAKKNITNDTGCSKDQEFSAFATHIESTDSPAEYVIVICKFDWTIQDQGTLIHEIVHVVMRIWQSNNIPVALDTQEFLAHSVGNLFEDIAVKIVRLKSNLVVHKTKKVTN